MNLYLRNRFPGFVLLTSLLLFPACELVSSTDNVIGVAFTTDRDRYDVLASDTDPPSLSFVIAANTKNTGSDAFQLTGCIVPNRPLLQKNVLGKWTTVYAVAEPECLSPPFVFQENEAHADTLLVDTVLDPDLSVGAKWENGIPVDGTYRLFRNIFGSGTPLKLLSDDLRASNEFEIRVFFED